MSAPSWSDVDDSIVEMVECIHGFMENLNTVRDYVENVDSSRLHKTHAQAYKQALHICDVLDASHYSSCEHAVNLFNTLQDAKGRTVGRG